MLQACPDLVGRVIFIYAALTHRDKKQHHFHHDWHHHRWVNYVVLRKYSFKVCVISFGFYSTHYKVYIYLPCIDTQWLKTAPLYSSRALPSSNLQTPIMYQGSDNCCEGYRNSDIICLLQPSLTIHYCNQSVLVIVLELNILVWSVMIFDLI